MPTTNAKPRKAETPWGLAALVDELTLPQRAGDKRFSTIVQLLETERGEPLVRFAYATTAAGSHPAAARVAASASPACANAHCSSAAA